MSLIKDGIYIGNWRDAQNRAFLVNHKITHILCSASELRPVFKKEYDYLHLNAQDTIYYNIFKHFDTASNYIKDCVESGGKILVHCFAGISRSSSFVLAYLIKHESLKLDQAIQLCRSKRSIVNPNPSFMTQLRRWEDAHHGENRDLAKDHISEMKSAEKPGQRDFTTPKRPTARERSPMNRQVRPTKKPISPMTKSIFDRKALGLGAQRLFESPMRVMTPVKPGTKATPVTTKMRASSTVKKSVLGHTKSLLQDKFHTDTKVKRPPLGKQTSRFQ